MRKLPIILYGSSYWNEIINFEALLRHGMISSADLKLFAFADDPGTALKLLQDAIEVGTDDKTPAFAPSRCRKTP